MEVWEALARAQDGMLARRQLTGLGFTHHRVRRQLDARRWVERSPRVVSAFTGHLTWEQRAWLGVLHAGGDAMLGALSALEWHGLRNWHRDAVTVIVDDELSFEPVGGIRYFRTRRPLGLLRDPRHELPVARAEPAALLFAGYERSTRTGEGLLAAVVQQRLASAASLLNELDHLRPLRRARRFRPLLVDISGGAQSLAEVDMGRVCSRFGLPRPQRQRRRRDSTGRMRFTDCEWRLPTGGVLVLEIDGAFHMAVEHWEDDLARHRRLSGPGRTIVRCTARELREEPEQVVDDLLVLGLSGLCA